MPRSKPLSKVAANHLLARLPQTVLGRLQPSLKLVGLELGVVVDTPSDRSRFAYFPTTAVISMVCVMRNGQTAETGMVGCEGMTGMATCLGTSSAISHSIVQVAGEAVQIRVRPLKNEFDRHGALHDMLLRYIYTLVAQISQSVGCNANHPIESRLSRWLLIVRDRVATDELLLQQECLSQMLGTRRSTVTIAAGALKRAGLIRYTRGRITIVDREALEARACECYAAVKAVSERVGSS